MCGGSELVVDMADQARLCVTNQKGGVGKTTVAINLAGALNERGREVLFVDLDPQGNATEGLGFVDAYDDEPPTILDALLDPEGVATEELIYDHPEMDVLTSSIDMTAAEATLLQEPDGETKLSRLLDSAASEYDYVVVDCPPQLGMLTDNALYAARNLVVPALAESTSKRALELLYDYVSALEDEHGIRIDTRALVINRIETTGEARSMIEWFEAAMDDVPTVKIRKRVALQRAFSARRSIFAIDEEIDMRDQFTEIATMIDEAFTRTEVIA